ncbi:MAG: hypothetical protein PHS98_04890 [Bacilli bacterium]|nr:hypothetical protein [Bacilli bacterium]
MKKNYTIVFLAVIVLFIGVSYAVYNLNHKSLSLVNISINPDVMLAVNGDDEVQDVISVNEEADVITSDLDLIGLDIEDATEKIIDAAIETGYLDEFSDENTIIVTTTNENEQVRTALEEKVMTRLNNRLELKKVYGLVVSNGVTDDMKADAEVLGISNGKMLLVSRALAVAPSLTKEALADMSVKDIQQTIKDNVDKRYEALNNTKDELKQAWQQDKIALKATRSTRLKEIEDELLDAAGVSVDSMTAEQKNKAIADAIKTKKGQIKKNVDAVKAELDDNLKDKSYSEINTTIRSVREAVRQGKKVR